jgi:hypothetical protein
MKEESLKRPQQTKKKMQNSSTTKKKKTPARASATALSRLHSVVEDAARGSDNDPLTTKMPTQQGPYQRSKRQRSTHGRQCKRTEKKRPCRAKRDENLLKPHVPHANTRAFNVCVCVFERTWSGYLQLAHNAPHRNSEKHRGKYQKQQA